jgi:ribosomal protein L40E
MPNGLGNPIPLAVICWCGIGLVGWLMMISKQSARPARAIGLGLFSIPHALIFGPLYFAIALAAQAIQVCPHCQSDIPAKATVCAKCTRDLPKQNW